MTYQQFTDFLEALREEIVSEYKPSWGLISSRIWFKYDKMVFSSDVIFRVMQDAINVEMHEISNLECEFAENETEQLIEEINDRLQRRVY